MTDTEVRPDGAPEYGAESITALEGLEPVRKRPGMYIGSTNSSGLHHCLWEVVDNSVDEAMAGHGTEITVTLHGDGSVSVQDRGRGIPVEPQTRGTYAGVPTVQMVLTALHAGGKFGQGGYTYSGGLHGVGISVVNALAEWTEVTVDRNGERHFMAFHAAEEVDAESGELKLVPGAVKEPLQRIKAVPKRQTGTLVRFMPDARVFSDLRWRYDDIARRLQNSAFLNAGLTTVLVDERSEEENPEPLRFHYPNGLRDFNALLTRERLAEWRSHQGERGITSEEPPAPVMSEPAVLSGEQSGVGAWDAVLQWYPDPWYRVHSYANGIETIDGGTHVAGMEATLTKLMNWFGRQEHIGILTDRDPNLEAVDVRSGLGVVLAVKVPEPQFQGQTKARLGNEDVKGLIRRGLYDQLQLWMEEHPVDARAAVQKMVEEMRLRRKLAEEAEKARAGTERRGFRPRSAPIPSKLTDCDTRDRSQAELFVVEGDSAAGSAIPARNRSTQAVLPIRGKILNVEVAAENAVENNREVQAIIAALGAGSEELFDLSQCRYQRVVILTDADVDGKHIQLLLMTLFYRLMRPLVEAGRLYVARSPLYSTSLRDGTKVYCYSDGEREEVDARHANLVWTRFKGLGEMNADQLGATGLDPATRRLARIEPGEDLEALSDLVWRLMGSEGWSKWEELSATELDSGTVTEMAAG